MHTHTYWLLGIKEKNKLSGDRSFQVAGQERRKRVNRVSPGLLLVTWKEEQQWDLADLGSWRRSACVLPTELAVPLSRSPSVAVNPSPVQQCYPELNTACLRA